MKKSVTKRIKFTRRGKLVRRKMGQDHFRAKKSRKQMARREGDVILGLTNKKNIIHYLHR